jgi:hypothetical protein
MILAAGHVQYHVCEEEREQELLNRTGKRWQRRGHLRHLIVDERVCVTASNSPIITQKMISTKKALSASK